MLKVNQEVEVAVEWWEVVRGVDQSDEAVLVAVDETEVLKLRVVAELKDALAEQAQAGDVLRVSSRAAADQVCGLALGEAAPLSAAIASYPYSAVGP